MHSNGYVVQYCIQELSVPSDFIDTRYTELCQARRSNYAKRPIYKHTWTMKDSGTKRPVPKDEPCQHCETNLSQLVKEKEVNRIPLEENSRYKIMGIPDNCGFNVYSKGTKLHPELEGKWVALFADRNVAINFMHHQARVDDLYDESFSRISKTHGDA